MTFLKLIRKLKKESSQLKIVCIGLDNAGKTTILHNILGIPSADIDPTFGYSLYTGEYLETSLCVYDIGGQVIFREHWNNYFERSDGIIFVYDMSDTREYINDLNRVVNEIPGVPILVLGNKEDLCLGSGNGLCIENDDIKFYRVSGLNKDTLIDPFTWFISRCNENLSFK
ncbi:hypothetical protein P3W45_001454 [Vairimorpha bombi]|jgi:ADP-ribosylation factor-like protein 2